jgi:hypothetical protein
MRAQQVRQGSGDLLEGFFLVTPEGGKWEDYVLLDLSHAQGAHKTGRQFVGHVPAPV